MRIENELVVDAVINLSVSNIPIVQKYREGKMKRTLKREFTDIQIAKGESKT